MLIKPVLLGKNIMYLDTLRCPTNNKFVEILKHSPTNCFWSLHIFLPVISALNSITTFQNEGKEGKKLDIGIPETKLCKITTTIVFRYGNGIDDAVYHFYVLF